MFSTSTKPACVRCVFRTEVVRRILLLLAQNDSFAKHTMTRTYIRRSDRGSYGIGRLQDAVKEMREKGLKLRIAARMYGIPKSTLERHVKKEVATMNATTLKLGPASCFSSVQEGELKKHILELESRGFGLTPTEIRTLAYDYAEANNIKHKFNKQKRVAGYDWLEGFMRRNPSLSLRKPEPLSLSRSMGMNKVRVQNFQSQLQDIFVRENFFDCPKAIYNVDETGISQVHKPPKIIAAKGKKNIYSTTSAEKGTTVTAVVCGNAAGDYIPPFLIFKGKRSNPLLATGAPSGTVVELSENGWIDKAIFLRWLQFFNKEAKRNAEGKCLLILDGHASHLTVEVLKYANENNIMLLCLPPHSTHWMQPLDKTVFKSIKCSYDKACAKFMRDNPGKPITRYDISRLFTVAYHSGATIGNLVNGFKYTGIFPLDAKAIPDHAFAPAETTEQATKIDLQEGAPAQSSENNDSLAAAETTEQATSNGLQEGASAQPSENDDSISNEDTGSEETVPSVGPEVSTDSSRNQPCVEQGTTSADTTSVGERVSFSDILPLPKAAPVKRKRNHKSLIGLVTSADVIERLEKEKKQQESAPKSQKNAKSRKSKGKLPAKKVKCKASAEQDPDNFCGYCHDYYYDMDDKDEDWLYCKRCLKWYHESCFGIMGGGLLCSQCKKTN